MTVKRFNDLSMIDKALLIYDHGTYIMSIQFGLNRISLYELTGTFVELYQDAKNHRITRIEVVQYEDIDKYLPAITLQGLPM